jgi:hypothetical protein
MVRAVLKRTHFHRPPGEERDEQTKPDGPVNRTETRAAAQAAKSHGEGWVEIVHGPVTKDLTRGLTGQPSSHFRAVSVASKRGWVPAVRRAGNSFPGSRGAGVACLLAQYRAAYFSFRASTAWSLGSR